MKKMIAMAMLVLPACAAPWGSTRAAADPFAGSWHGVVARGGFRGTADFQFAPDGAGYRGVFWGPAVAVPLSNVQLGRAVHFEGAEIGIFDGTSDGNTIEGTFHDAAGAGTFRLDKQLDWDDPVNAM